MFFLWYVGGVPTLCVADGVVEVPLGAFEVVTVRVR